MDEKRQKRKEDALNAFGELIDIIDTLRSPLGCPWDRKQTSKSLKPYFVEETYEVLDAIDSENPSDIKEELGDVLLQIMLHSQIGFEQETFHVGDVIKSISNKMIERHPHVFSTTQVDGVDEVLTNWEKIKSKKNGDKGLLDGIPSHVPGLLKAFRMGQKAGRVGFDWLTTESVRQKVLEELEEVDEAISEKDTDAIFHEFGDLLFAISQWSRHLQVEPEEAVRQCCNRFYRRFSGVQAQLHRDGKKIDECEIDELERIWQQVKQNERK